MIKRSISAIALAALVVTLPPSLDATTFRATLSSMKLYGRPGQVLTRQFQLTLNEDQRRTHFRARVEDWWRSEDGRQSFFAAPGTLKRSCGEWVTLNPVEAAVEPGATLTVRLTIAISTDAEPGGYWCVLTLDEVPDPLRASEGVGIRFLASVSTGIFVYINPLERAAEITGVQVLADRAVVTLRNDGNTPVAVEGRFEFFKPGESKVHAVARLRRGTLLPEPIASGTFSADLPDADALPSGRYLVKAIVDFGLDHYLGVQRELEVRREQKADARMP